MINKVQVRSKSNLHSSTPQSKNQPSTISLKFNSWLTRFNLQPKVDPETEPKLMIFQPSEQYFDKLVQRESPVVRERPRPISKPSENRISTSPKKTPSRPLIKQDEACRVPSQTMNTLKNGKPPLSGKFEALSEYTIGNTLGIGAYGTVKYGVHRLTGQKVAIKVYDKAKICSANQQKCIETEIKILMQLEHQNIVKLYNRIDTPKFLYIVLEFISGYSLSASLKRKPSNRLEEYEACRYFQEILQALEYCHSKGITHRDIKLENILLDVTQKKIKLIDFGFATCFSNQKKVKIFCGTPSYMAPEIVTHKEYCGPPVDVWAAGVLLYVLLTGTFPFKGSTDNELYKNILKGRIAYPEYLSIAAKQLINKMLKVDPQNRPKIKDLLKDCWFRSANSIFVSKVLPVRHERISENPKIGNDDNSPKFKFNSSFHSLDLQICSTGEKNSNN